jgi:hypothetical protein
MSNPKAEYAKWIADALRHSWRTAPSPLNLSEDQLSAITPLLIQSGAAGLVWPRARVSTLKESKSALRLRRAFLSQVLQSALREHELSQLFKSMQQAGVEPIVVKGWAIARQYPEKGLRPQGDIDLIVRPEHLPAAQGVLDSPDCASLNVDLEHREFGKLGTRALDELYERSRKVPITGIEVRVLAAEDHLSFLCRHSLRHAGWRPLWLCDIAVELENRPDTFNWDLVLRQRNCRAVESAVLLAHHLIGASIESTPLLRNTHARRLPKWFVKAVLKQWEISDPMAHPPFNHLKPMATYFRNPSGLLEGLAARWPDPVEATVSLGGSFNAFPRFPFQMAECFLRTARLISGAFNERREHQVVRGGSPAQSSLEGAG